MASTITGGTPAPKGPPGVPKGKPGAPPRFLNKASGKMETKQAMGNYRAPAARQQAAARIANPKGVTTVGAGGHGGTEVARSWLDMNPSELHNYAAKSVQQNTQSELGPYRQKAGEIYGTEQAVAGRYAGYGQQTDQQLQGLQGQAAEGAKTYNNQVADTVLKAQQSVDTTGQNAQAQNAGYMDPQLRAALTAQRGNVTETGLAAQTAAQGQGQNEQNFMANLRAAATQRVAEGQRGITGTYGKQQAANSQEQNRLLGRQPGAITKLETELGQKQFNAKATEAGLGIKLTGIQQKTQEGTANRVQRETASQRSAATTERGQNLKQWEGEADRIWKETHGPGGKPAKPPKAPSPAEGRKYMANISKAESIAQQQLGPQKYDHGRQEQVRKYLRDLGYSNDQVSAALNLSVYGHLGPNDRKTAEAYGLTPKMRASWFQAGSVKAVGRGAETEEREGK